MQDIPQWIWDRGHVRFPVVPPLGAAGTEPATPILIQEARYVRHTICDVEVWAVEVMRLPQIIELLVQRYARR